MSELDVIQGFFAKEQKEKIARNTGVYDGILSCKRGCSVARGGMG